ncbi:MAG: sialate O-acetylesterase [Planctomycetota bacterium]|nr:sialate O-acetylesterase [Planctomycetota bacterium]
MTSAVSAEVTMSSLFTDHMVIQRDIPVVIWGTAAVEEEIHVVLAGHAAKTQADPEGHWRVKLPALKVGSGPHQLVIEGSNRIEINDILIGEVWVCSGQSNMAFAVSSANDPDLESLSANFPQIRIISVPQIGSQTPLDNFQGKWETVTPETVKSFSAVGYFFGRQLHQTLHVPIGLIDTAWGGSACEAWVPRDVLEEAGEYQELLAKWDDAARAYDPAAVAQRYERQLKAWKLAMAQALQDKKPVPRRPRPPRNILTGQHRPANLYNGVLNPIVGYGIRGAIWYQGEHNSGRAYQYRNLFPLMIETWRKRWNQGDFSFYWVSLADFQDEVAEPTGSTWAELREAQTMVMSKLPNTGEAIILDLGEAHDIHPRNKQDVAKRLARWALAKDYGIDIVYRSPIYQSHQIQGNRMVITFDHVGGGLDTFDVREVRGFAIAGEDQKFVNAQARIVGTNQVEVWDDSIPTPVAVRYAWAQNPICNLQNKEHLPATSFRTDSWDGVTKGIVK